MAAIKEGSMFIARAIAFEKQFKFSDALDCYEKGLEICMKYMKVAPESDKPKLRDELNQYMTRAEKIKSLVDKQLKYHKEIVIGDDSVGHSYETVFGSYLNDDVQEVRIEDSYVQQPHQLINLLRFCELIVKKSKILRRVTLVTRSNGETKQAELLGLITNSLKDRDVDFNVEYSSTMHDRKITFSNGWVFLPGRGLDYFKKSKQMSLGSFDLDLRPCHETKINIHFQPDLNL